MKKTEGDRESVRTASVEAEAAISLTRRSLVKQGFNVKQQPDQQGPPSSQTASKDPGTVLELLEKHLDPMVHEAEMAHSLYSPDTSLPRPVSPVFVLSTAGNAAIAKPEWKREKLVDVFLEELITPMQQPLLPAPGDKTRRPCRNKHYKKPLSPAAVKTIAALVEKGAANRFALVGRRRSQLSSQP